MAKTINNCDLQLVVNQAKIFIVISTLRKH